MKNPFRTRYAVQAERNTTPEYLRLNGDPATKYCVVYRKWWQRSWRYAEMEYTGFGFCKMPVFYNSKQEAIASNSRILIN